MGPRAQTAILTALVCAIAGSNTGAFAAEPAKERRVRRMTYLHKGRQYLIVATGGAGTPGRLVAFALPARKT
jgi:hypothetical protein